MASLIIDKNLIPVDVHVDNEFIRVRFSGGLQIATPTALFPRLQNASPEDRAQWRVIGRGDGIHWPGADEDISVKGLLAHASSSAGGAYPQVA